MVTMKRYFLYVLMFNSFCLSAMEVDKPEVAQEQMERMEHVVAEMLEQIEHIEVTELERANLVFDTHIKSIADKIDRDRLKINVCECGHLKSLLGSLVSFVIPHILPYEQCANEIQTIMSYIPENVDKKKALKRLIADHWYVYYLIKKSVTQKINELNNVTGSTIDVIYDDYINRDESDPVKRMVCDDAYKIFFDDTNIMPENLFDIHYTILYAPDRDIKHHSLLMSSDGKYVKATDNNNTRLIWDMETGKLANAEHIESDMWIASHKSLSLQDRKKQYNYNYKAMILDKNDSSLPTQREYNGVFVFKYPEEASYLCQRAFENSRTVQEFDALGRSKPAEQITGFVKDNLTKAIQGKTRLFVDYIALGRSTQ